MTSSLDMRLSFQWFGDFRRLSRTADAAHDCGWRRRPFKRRRRPSPPTRCQQNLGSVHAKGSYGWVNRGVARVALRPVAAPPGSSGLRKPVHKPHESPPGPVLASLEVGPITVHGSAACLVKANLCAQHVEGPRHRSWRFTAAVSPAHAGRAESGLAGRAARARRCSP